MSTDRRVLLRLMFKPFLATLKRQRWPLRRVTRLKLFKRHMNSAAQFQIRFDTERNRRQPGAIEPGDQWMSRRLHRGSSLWPKPQAGGKAIAELCGFRRPIRLKLLRKTC